MNVSGSPDLTAYPRPSVAVDAAVLTVPPDRPLSVVLIEDGHGRRLPGTFVRERERLDDAVRRGLAAKTGIETVELQQLHVFDAPHRDDRGWVLSVAYLAVAPWTAIRPPALVVPAAETGALAFDHDQIVERALLTIRQDYRARPDPYRLIAEPFTIRQLHDLHQQVAGEILMRDSFRRTMSPFLRETGELATGTVGKPARRFIHRRVQEDQVVK
ncbi:NUDIX hydrolase [Mycetocola zhadangensis]|uniref:NUDIX domain-containing protein n=1 Tax=Mycetocola zhadangensis TaxID=1164595 RepID=A0A3L7J5B2_9MICO|nr:NUDIX domain-containing protein [Mycetocola zhadangensis]RLQ85639.1 NUDIX domain-containing protein [Mycetocola zhadangensis]GGE84367.1 NUDIX hydrolase [Mycetocola zhadangensis]